MTEPSQYFKGRTVQEQMDEVIGYVDKRAREVAAAKADAVLQPAEDAKTAAQAAAVAAEAAKDTTIAALPEIRQDISALKAEDTTLDGRLDTVELKVTTAEGNIDDLQAADANNVKITGTHNIGDYAVLLTGNQDPISGVKTFANHLKQKNASWEAAPRIYQSTNINSLTTPAAYFDVGGGIEIRDMNERTMWSIKCYRDTGGRDVLSIDGNASDGTTAGFFHLEVGPNGYRKITTNFDKPSTW